jgi:hypothetical protein
LSVVLVKSAMSEKKTVSFLRVDAISTPWGPGEDRVVDLGREVFRELLGERLELLVLERDDLVGVALLLAEGVVLLLVAIAQAHQAARGAKQLLIVLEQLFEALPVLAVGEAAARNQCLRRREDFLLGRE